MRVVTRSAQIPMEEFASDELAKFYYQGVDMESQTKVVELTEVLARSPSIHEDNRYPILIVREAVEKLGLEWRVGLKPEKHLEIGDQGLRLSVKHCDLIIKSAKLKALIWPRNIDKEGDVEAVKRVANPVGIGH